MSKRNSNYNGLVTRPSLFIKKKFHPSFYSKIFHVSILASTSLATAIIAPYYCHSYINSNTTSCISTLALSGAKVLCVYRVITLLPTFKKRLLIDQRFAGPDRDNIEGKSLHTTKKSHLRSYKYSGERDGWLDAVKPNS